jgi:hypothetical protein
MSYLGSSAAPLPVAFAGVNGQSFNGGTNTFTLSRSVSKTTDIELVVNNVQQNPYDGSYSVSGNVLTTAEAVSAGVANVYVGYRDAPLGSFSPIAGSVFPSSMSTGAPTWNANGNTGIGGAPPSTGIALTLPNTDVLTFAGTDGNFATNGYYSGGWKYITPGAAGKYSVYGSAHYWYGAASGSANGAISFVQTMSLDKDKSLALQGANSYAGAGITFPATQNPSSDANTLDDYEEGTWTPIVTGSTSGTAGAYGNQVGRYVKIGSLVTVTGFLTFTKGTILGAVTISLPFTAGTYTGYGDSTPISGTWSWAGDMPKLMLTSSAQASAYMWDANTNTITDVDLSASGSSNNIVFSLTYRAAA